MRRSAARILIIFIWSVLGTACVLFAAFVFMANVPLTPSLTPAKAAALISGRPEFNRYATLVAVSSTTRGADSLKDCCYTAEVTFVQNGSKAVIQAYAEFHYNEHAWHLDDLWYGEPPNVKNIVIEADVAPSARK